MVIFKKANINQIERLVEISKAAFDTDIEVGASEFGGPPNYDCMKWHRQMCKNGNLYVLVKDEAMQQIEKVDAEKHILRLETSVLNQRTNSFYPKCGYEEMYRDEESVYYQKVL